MTNSLKSLLAAIGLLLAQPAMAETGDCDGDGHVAVNELVTAVRMSLKQAPMSTCPAADRNGDGRVTIDELVTAVRQALTPKPSQQRAFVVTTNFVAGSFATVDLDEPRTVSPSTSERRIHRDAVVRTHGGLVYVINRRFGDNLQILDPEDDYRTILQCSTGNGTNPHDIVFASEDKAYISLYEEPELLIVNPGARPDCSDFVIGSIDLGGIADPDGVPDMSQMAIVGQRLYVGLQLLDINTILRPPTGPGRLAVIDITTDALVDTIELTAENPFAATKGLIVRNGKIWVAGAGDFDVRDGGLESVDLTRGESDGIVVSEADLGGDITDFVFVEDRLAYAVVSRPGFVSALVSFDPTTGQVLDTLLQSNGFNLFDIELNDRGELFLADRTRQRDGLRIYRAADGAELTTDPIDLGLAPFEIVFID